MSENIGNDMLAGSLNIERYPILNLDGAAARKLISQYQEQMAAVGACVLENFLLPGTVAEIIAELAENIDDAYFCQHEHNLYLAADDDSFPDDHVRNRHLMTDVGCLAMDQIPDGSILRSIYTWDKFQQFIAAILGSEKLYPYADPLGSLNVNIFKPGQQHAWHFDNADWVSTIMLQPAEAGGVYEYVPNIRSEIEPEYENVQAILDGARGDIRALNMEPGSLVLFRGRHSLHRVSPVMGNNNRLIAVLSYDTKPGVTLTEFNRQLFYGRIA